MVNGLNSNNAVYDDTGSPAEYIQTLYIDDWSMRLCVPDGFPETKRLSVDYNEETQTLTYKFNLDIDPRTVRKENIEVNGVRGDAFIESSVLETTDEETREHTLTLKLQNLENENMITVILADVKDAWGREVLNNPPFTLNNFPEGQYTIFNDLDDTGAWKYRELIYDPECETTEYLWDGLNGAQPTPPQTPGSSQHRRAQRKLQHLANNAGVFASWAKDCKSGRIYCRKPCRVYDESVC